MAITEARVLSGIFMDVTTHPPVIPCGLGGFRQNLVKKGIFLDFFKFGTKFGQEILKKILKKIPGKNIAEIFEKILQTKV